MSVHASWNSALQLVSPQGDYGDIEERNVEIGGTVERCNQLLLVRRAQRIAGLVAAGAQVLLAVVAGGEVLNLLRAARRDRCQPHGP
jgi:hypothetical protein